MWLEFVTGICLWHLLSMPVFVISVELIQTIPREQKTSRVSNRTEGATLKGENGQWRVAIVAILVKADFVLLCEISGTDVFNCLGD